MADNEERAYVGYRSAGRRPEKHQDREAAANAPLNVLRGWAAGTLGLPGDIESLVRMLPGLSEKNILPTTEYIEERLPLRDMSPTGRAFTGAGTLAGGVGVGTGAKAASRGAQALAPAAGALAMRAAELSGAPVYGMGVIKPKGGNWLAGSVEKPTEMLKQGYVPDYERWGEGAAGVTDQAKGEAAALNKWLDKKLYNYIKNEMGTPEDPIRLLAEKGVTHAEVAPVTTRALSQLEKRREAVGFPAEGMGKSEQARAWEAAADDIISNLPASERLNTTMAATQKNIAENPWLLKVPPETMTYGTHPMEFDGVTQFGHMIDELRNAVNPESGLPANLRWKYADLDKVNMEQAVQRVHDINQWRAAQQAEANAMRANNAAAFLHKDYPDAPYKWVELKMPQNNDDISNMLVQNEGKYSILEPGEKLSWKDPRYGRVLFDTPEQAMHTYKEHKNYSALEDALKYEGETMGHCVGGYCPDVTEGRSRIFSLRNKKTGEPHVTVEVRPEAAVTGGKFSDVFDEAMKHVNEDEYAALEAEYGDDLFQGLKDRYGSYISNPTETIPDIVGTFGEEAAARYAQHLKDNPLGLAIEQIKGKANKAPKEEYLPYVQDFVRSSKWSDVGDLRNAGMQRSGWTPELLQEMKQHGIDAPEYGTAEEINNALNFLNKAKGFARGGEVDIAAEYSPLEVDYIIGNVNGYAEGGLVEDKKSDVPDIEFQDPESLRLYKHAMKMGVGPTEVNAFGTGVNAGNLNLGFDTARVNPEASDRLMNSLIANYGVKLGDVGVNANLRKPLDAEGVYLGMLNGTVPVGQGMAMLGVQGIKTPYGKEVTGYNAGWSGKAGPGRLNVNVMQPKSHPSNRSAQVMYQVPFAEGGSVEIAHVPYDEAKISSLVNALREELHA